MLCYSTFKYVLRSQKLPIHTIAFYDIGKKPKNLDLKRLTLGEKLAMSKVIVYWPMIHFRPVYGYGKGNAGIKGHSFGIKCSQDAIERSLVQLLPRHDLEEVIHLNLCGEKEMTHIAMEIMRKQGPLHIDVKNILLWLGWLKELENPHFKDVEIRTEPEAVRVLQASINKIIQNAFHSTSATVNKLMGQSRSEKFDEEDELNANLENQASFIRHTLIAEEPDDGEPMQKVLEKIQKKIFLFISMGFDKRSDGQSNSTKKIRTNMDVIL